MRRYSLVVVTAALAASGCASQEAAKGGQPVETQARIANITYFDLASCFPAPIEVPSPVTQEALIGFLVTARPELNECFVDPKHRGPALTTQATIEATVTDQGPAYKITGENLTPEGTACVENVLKQRAGLEPLAKGAAPVTGKIDFQHTVGQSPAVQLGVNEPSDVVGAIRLAIPGWCDCFEPWRSSPPHALTGKIELTKASPTPTAVTFDPPKDEASGKVQACLGEKVKAMQFTVTSEKVSLPLNFLLIHSGISEPLSGERPELSILQFDSIRAQAAANVAMQLGARANAAQNWADMVAKYKANSQAYTLKQLEEGCGGLITADDTLLAALEKQRDNEQRTLDFVKEQAQKDAAWNEAVTAAQGQVDAVNKEIENTKQLRASDQGGCPKVSYDQTPPKKKKK